MNISKSSAHWFKRSAFGLLLSMASGSALSAVTFTELPNENWGGSIAVANDGTIALSGGCFQNATLLETVAERLPDLELCLPVDVPANDGGLAFGQALVALAQLETE